MYTFIFLSMLIGMWEGRRNHGMLQMAVKTLEGYPKL
jgi:hypothetical protein